MNDIKLLSKENANKSNYYPYKSERKSSTSQIITTDKYMNNYIFNQYQNYMNPINYNNKTNKNYLYPNYYTNYSTSNNYNINSSLQNFYYERNNLKNNQYLYSEDNDIPNNNYKNYINKGVNRKLIKEAKENLKNENIENNMNKKRKNNYVRLNIVHCETQYPIMTCLNADPYNRLKKKNFFHNYNNINNYIINSNSFYNNGNMEKTNEDRIDSLQNESLFNIGRKNKSKFKEFNKSYNDFRKKNIKNIDIIKNYFPKNQNEKTNLKEKTLITDFKNQKKLSKFKKYLSLNNGNKEKVKISKNKNDYNEKKSLEGKIKKFIGLIEKYFIYSFYNLFHNFLSQMAIFIEEKIYENKNLLLKRFQRVRNKSGFKNIFRNYTPEKILKLDSNHNKTNQGLYIPKKQYKYIGHFKKNVHNINIISSHKNLNKNKIVNNNDDFTFKNEETFQKKIISNKNNNSVDKLSKRHFNFYNKNRSQDNLLYIKKLSPSPPVDVKEKKYILRTNLNNNENKKKLIYTKKRTNKFNVKKKFIIDENINEQNVTFTFSNLYGTGSPKNNKYKLNERYEYRYNDYDENEETIEQIIIKDICTYDKKFSVFIKYMTSQQYEENYLRLKLKKLQNLYLNNTLEYIGTTHTDSIFLPAIYINSEKIMNEIIEEKESGNFSNLQEDEKNLNNLFNILIYIYKQKNISYFQLFFNSLKEVIKKSINADSQGRNNINKKMFKSKTYFNLKNKFILSENYIDLSNNKLKRSNSSIIMMQKIY